jgi:ABC-type transport system involved in cytochrome bd biosynthesis fused ATPase/permease subunit
MEDHVVAGYESLVRGRTTIVITHREEMARRAGRVVRVERGGLRDVGEPRDRASAGVVSLRA